MQKLKFQHHYFSVTRSLNHSNMLVLVLDFINWCWIIKNGSYQYWKLFLLFCRIKNRNILLLHIINVFTVTFAKKYIMFTSNILMEVYHSFYENVKQQQLFLNIEIFQPISILEWFLKDHVKLKTEEMAAENSNLHHRNNLNIFNYIKT